jgi:hypothetical protein
VEPALHALQPGLVAQAQIFVADPLRSGEQRVSELDRLEVKVAVERLEPFGRIARAVLQLQHLDIALRLIFFERRLSRQPGRFSTSASLIASSSASLVPEPIEKVRGVGGVAEQDQVAIGPALADDAAEAEPGLRARQMLRVGLQSMAVQISGEDAFAQRDRRRLVHAVEPQRGPGLRRHLDDESRKPVIEAVSVGPHPARLGLLEGERKGLERLAVPNQKNLLRRPGRRRRNAARRPIGCGCLRRRRR